MSFEVVYDKQPIKFLKKQDKNIAKRIMDKIDQLLIESLVPHDAKTMVGKHGVFRIRIGDYRFLYRINYSEKKIIIFQLDKRENIY